MVTSNEDDFMRLSAAWLRSGREHCGIIVIKQQRFTVRDQVRRFRRLYEEVTADEMKNRVEFLSHWADRD